MLTMGLARLVLVDAAALSRSRSDGARVGRDRRARRSARRGDARRRARRLRAGDRILGAAARVRRPRAAGARRRARGARATRRTATSRWCSAPRCRASRTTSSRAARSWRRSRRIPAIRSLNLAAAVQVAALRVARRRGGRRRVARAALRAGHRRRDRRRCYAHARAHAHRDALSSNPRDAEAADAALAAACSRAPALEKEEVNILRGILARDRRAAAGGAERRDDEQPHSSLSAASRRAATAARAAHGSVLRGLRPGNARCAADGARVHARGGRPLHGVGRHVVAHAWPRSGPPRIPDAGVSRRTPAPLRAPGAAFLVASLLRFARCEIGTGGTGVQTIDKGSTEQPAATRRKRSPERRRSGATGKDSGCAKLRRRPRAERVEIDQRAAISRYRRPSCRCCGIVLERFGAGVDRQKRVEQMVERHVCATARMCSSCCCRHSRAAEMLSISAAGGAIRHGRGSTASILCLRRTCTRSGSSCRRGDRHSGDLVRLALGAWVIVYVVLVDASGLRRLVVGMCRSF